MGNLYFIIKMEWGILGEVILSRRMLFFFMLSAYSKKSSYYRECAHIIEKSPDILIGEKLKNISFFQYPEFHIVGLIGVC